MEPDWLDSYLDALSQDRKAVYPPDTHTWKKIQPSKKQQSMIQDAAVFDLQHMRLVQESRKELEETEHSGDDSGSSAGPALVPSPTPTPSNTSPTPTPTPSPTPTPTPGKLLVEDGSFVLQQDNSKILLE